MILLNSIFNFGDTYNTIKSGGFDWWDFLSKIFIAGLTVGGAYYLYTRKRNDDYDRDIEKKEEILINDMKYFSSVYTINLEDIKEQIVFYTNYSEKVKKNYFSHHNIVVKSLDTMKRMIDTFDHNRIFDAYLFKYKDEPIDEVVKRFVGIFKSFDIFLTQHNYIFEAYNDYKEYLDTNLRKYADLAYEKLMPQMQDFVLKNPDHELRLKILELMLNHHQASVNTDRPHTVMNELIVVKLKALITVDISNFSNNELSILIETIHAMDRLYNMIEDKGKNIVRNFETNINFLNTLVSNLEGYKSKV